MNLKQLILKGYLPKELPPPFNSVDLANKASTIYSKIKAEELRWDNDDNLKVSEFRRNNFISNGTIYKIPKGKFTRRKVQILNPISHLILSKTLISNLALLKSIYKLSNSSKSKPSIRTGAKRAFVTKSESLTKFWENLIEISYNRKVLLKIDITQFYPSIYTHSITWAILGKEKAKEFYSLQSRNRKAFNALIASGNKEAKLYQLADLVDTQIRNCQSKHSIGLPIGPDVSFMLAELIASRIDNNIQKQISDIDYSYLRYFDDYYVFTNSYSEAENLLKIFQKHIETYNLETNGEKISIHEGPFYFDTKWSVSVREFDFGKKTNKEKLKNYFNLIFKHLGEYPNDSDWILRFSLKRFENGFVIIDSSNWKLFESFILRSLTIEPRIIDQVINLLLSYVAFLTNRSKKRIQNVFNSVIENHIGLNHSFEVSWGLWGLLILKLDANRNIIKTILEGENDVAKIIAVDLINKNQIKGRKPALSQFKKSTHSSNLMTESWLFNYTIVQKNWIIPDQGDYKTAIASMKYLYDENISFYNEVLDYKPKFVFKPEVTDVEQNDEPEDSKWTTDYFDKLLEELDQNEYIEQSEISKPSVIGGQASTRISSDEGEEISASDFEDLPF